MRQNIVLNAFGLTKKMSIPRMEKYIYIAWIKPISAQFFYGDNINPSVTPSIMKARFEWKGKYEKGKPIYEFMGLDL
ncbi:MAG: hypothetical protein AABY22_06930 [Nanoarchaeota archaeon]